MASIKLKHMSLWDYKTVKKITFSLTTRELISTRNILRNIYAKHDESNCNWFFTKLEQNVFFLKSGSALGCESFMWESKVPEETLKRDIHWTT